MAEDTKKEPELTVEEKEAQELAAKKLAVMQSAFAEFQKNYIPITLGTERNAEMKKSKDLTEMFEEFTGLSISRFDMVNLMKEAGFTFKLIGEDLFWLVMKV